MFEDKTLTCRECGQQFVFTCRAARRAANGGSRPERQMYDVICDGCGRPTQVPFQPRGDRPVYCRECFEAQRNAR